MRSLSRTRVFVNDFGQALRAPALRPPLRRRQDPATVSAETIRRSRRRCHYIYLVGAPNDEVETEEAAAQIRWPTPS